MLMIAMPVAALGDRGAFSVDGGAVLSAARVPPGVGNGDSVFGSVAGVTLGARYAFRNDLEVSANGVWFQEAPFYNDNTSVTTPDGVFVGQAQNRVGRLGATIGAHYVTGLVWRLRVGAEVGWSRLVFRHLDLVDVSDPTSPRSFGLRLGDRTVDGIVVAPVAGVEWIATDHLSFAITPRIDFLLGEPTMTAFTVPITVSWSWYGWFR